MSTISSRLRKCIKEKGCSHRELERITGIPHAAIQRYASGTTEKIPISRVKILAQALGVTAEYLLGWEAKDLGVRRIPLLGRIACGEPIFAEEEFGEYVYTNEGLDADFCLRCVGDSMIGARIHDGDFVFVRRQSSVDNGEIAAVIIEDEATLKRVYFDGKKLVLSPENPSFAPLVYTGEELDRVKILGKAVAFQSTIR